MSQSYTLTTTPWGLSEEYESRKNYNVRKIAEIIREQHRKAVLCMRKSSEYTLNPVKVDNMCNNSLDFCSFFLSVIHQ